MWITFREKFKSAFELFDLSIRNEQGKPHVPTLYLKLQHLTTLQITQKF